MGLIEAFPIGGGIFIEIMLIITPIWTAFVLGLVIGWTWRPKWWENLDKNLFDSFVSKIADFSAPFYSPSIQNFTPFNLNFSSLKGQSAGDAIISESNDSLSLQPRFDVSSSTSSSKLKKGEENDVVNQSDVVHLFKLVEEKDGGPSWIQMMDRSTPTMRYRAWRRDPETGPPQYRSSTIFEDATPEMVRDFFWDDEFRPKWDTMLIDSKILEESQSTGTMIAQWVRKFPFFCSDREYIIGRRIWESGRTYYCVTKGVPNTVPRKDKPRRVDLYYSSWCIRPVESSKGDGQMTACEVLLFHHEDMGIPWEIAKLGVRQGMWGAVKKIDPGLRVYQKARAAGRPLSSSASMAQITTKVNPNFLNSQLSGDDQSVTEVAPPEEKQRGMNVPKLLVFSGAVALACSLDRGLLTKAVIFGVARKLGRIGGKL